MQPAALGIHPAALRVQPAALGFQPCRLHSSPAALRVQPAALCIQPAALRVQVALTPFLCALYLVRPQLLHRFVGYLEETAVHTCTHATTNTEP